ncbi:MAG: bifunctional response regulator/alkaline phosphatase family protein [Cyclobacteriaceae bacterium]
MQKYRILWADDEIDLLKPHILFLSNKGFEITGVNSGADALEEIENQTFDLVFLDENMPGMTGLETLTHIKSTNPNLPVVMITKSEEEYIMEEAIGAKISDYLIKPLNPNQILLSVKKILDNRRIVSEHTNQGYQQDFQNLSMTVQEMDDHQGWAELYRKLVYWELEIGSSEDKSMLEILNSQRIEANQRFSDFIEDEYKSWLNDPDIDRPLMSHQVLKKRVFPLLKEEKAVFLIVIDNLRFDQWEILEPEISTLFNVKSKDSYYSILPTTTAYARNALFAGMMPLDISKKHPELWVGEDVDEGKNMYEEELLKKHLKREHLDIKSSYHKIVKTNDGKSLVENVKNLMSNDLNAIVYNFVDMLSHARTDMQMIRELAPDEAAYRSITKSWFEHSSLLELLKYLSNKDVKVVITTDHGTIRVKKPYKIVGDRNTNTNLRYKAGRNLAFDDKGVLASRNPAEIGLPQVNMSTSFAFAREDNFFAYPNNYNYYVNFYKDTFQHGGISMEEVIVPLIELESK